MSMREVPAPERAGGDDGPADRPDLVAGPLAGGPLAGGPLAAGPLAAGPRGPDLVDGRGADTVSLSRPTAGAPGLAAVTPGPAAATPGPASVVPRPAAATPGPPPAVPRAAGSAPDDSGTLATNGGPRRPSNEDLLRPSTTRRGGDPPRGGRSHSASRGRKPANDGGNRSRKPAAQVKPARARTIVYEDQTHGGDDAPAVEVRKVRRVLRRIDTWSLFRFAVMLYACAMLVFLVAAVGLWIVASTAGAIPSIEHFITSLFALKKFHFRTGQLFLASLGLGIVWVLAATLFTTVAAVLYNLISDVVGGIELTVLEEEPVEIVD